MALNDLMLPKNGKTAQVSLTAAENSTNLATNSFNGRAPLGGVLLRAGTQAVSYAFKTGGPYSIVAAGGEVDLGVFKPGDPATLFHLSAGGASTAFLDIYN